MWSPPIFKETPPIVKPTPIAKTLTAEVGRHNLWTVYGKWRLILIDGKKEMPGSFHSRAGFTLSGYPTKYFLL